MGIRADAYQLCKTAMNSSSREQVKDLVHKLNGTYFGYVARKQNAQVLGYLMVDQERETLGKAPLPEPIPPLGDAERQLLNRVHMQIVHLNRQCAVRLTTVLHRCSRAVDPYNTLQYNAPVDTSQVDILTSEAINTMARSFHAHPAIAAVLKSPEPIVSKLTETQYTTSVLGFTDGLLREGVSHTPQDLTQIAFTEGHHSNHRLAARHLIALMCVRASIATLDQLVYQAILSNKLPVLTEDNIIEIGGLRGTLRRVASRSSINQIGGRPSLTLAILSWSSVCRLGDRSISSVKWNVSAWSSQETLAKRYRLNLGKSMRTWIHSVRCLITYRHNSRSC